MRGRYAVSVILCIWARVSVNDDTSDFWLLSVKLFCSFCCSCFCSGKKERKKRKKRRFERKKCVLRTKQKEISKKERKEGRNKMARKEIKKK